MHEISFIAAFILGLLIHLLSTLIEDGKIKGERVPLRQFIKNHPYQLSLSILFSVVAYFLFDEMNQLNFVSALAAGYMGDSIVKKVMGGVKLK